jgi:hypothetical protein
MKDGGVDMGLNFLNLGVILEVNGQLYTAAALFPKRHPSFPIGQEAGLVLERPQLREEEKIIVPTGNRTPIPLSCGQ